MDTSESVIQELDSAFEVSPTGAGARGQKRKSESSENKVEAPKKIVLNRNPSVSSDTNDTNQNGSTNNAPADKTDGTTDKKVIKLSELSVKEVFIRYCSNKYSQTICLIHCININEVVLSIFVLFL